MRPRQPPSKSVLTVAPAANTGSRKIRSRMGTIVASSWLNLACHQAVALSYLHHLTVDLLRECFYSIKRSAAAGVDRVKWDEYAQGWRNG